MNVLITGSNGFVGRNLVENLKNIRDGKNRTRPDIHIDNIYEFDLSSAPGDMEKYCASCDFVFHLAGVNRPEKTEDFQTGNADLTRMLLKTLENCGNTCPVMLSSSVQATLSGRFGNSAYGRSKLAAEELLFSHETETCAKALVYRFPNLAGKWCRPNYNSAVATFCHNIAHDLPITVNDPAVKLELLFIDDLVEEMLNAIEGKAHRCDFDGVESIPTETGRYCYAPGSHKVTLGRIVELLHAFHDQPDTLMMPHLAPDSLEKKLYSTYLSYLPKEKIAVDLKSNADTRGSFTELLKTADHGQFSVNISKPGVTKGQHWHNSKWEYFIVVSGHGLIQERRIGSDEVLEFEVSGESLQAVHMLPGYTHNIINLSETDNLVTLMWANEIFDPERPDTFREEV